MEICLRHLMFSGDLLWRSHEKNYEDSRDISFFVRSPWTASKSSRIPANLMFKGWLYIFPRRSTQVALINHFVCHPSNRFACKHLLLDVKCAEKSTHDSIVRLCCTRDCLHWKKTRSNSFGIQAILNSWMEIYFCLSPKVLGCNATAELLEKKALQEVGDANDSDCVDSRFSNHLSPDLRYFAFYKRISSERFHDVVAFSPELVKFKSCRT